MDPNIKKAEEYIAEAQKSHKGFLSSFFGGTDKNEKRAQLYESAANCYKMAKASKEAGNAYKEAAELNIRANNALNAVTNYRNAATILKKEDPLESIQCLKKAIDINKDSGRSQAVAKSYMDIAQMYEELGDPKQAIQNYKEAADFYDQEDCKSLAYKCRTSEADLSVKLGDYQRAAELYDEVGRAGMRNSLLKYGAPKLLMYSTICKLHLGDNDAMKSYLSTFPTLDDKREFKLLMKLSTALETKDETAFTLTVKEYDSISRLDDLMTTMLLELKKTIVVDEEEDIT